MLFTLLNLLDLHPDQQQKTTCLQCGQCCESFGGHLRASPHDLKRWEEHGRQDLLDATNRLGWIWVDPVTKECVSPCPQIDRSDPEKVTCRIYEDRPDMCRDYPTLAHGKRCLRGVFLGCWAHICCSPLPQWVAVIEELPLAA